MNSDEIQVMEGLVLGIGLIILSTLNLIFVQKIINTLDRSFLKRFILPGDGPKYRIGRSKIASIIFFAFGLYILILTINKILT